ncbi:NAD(P)H-dependent oxidoreductase [Microbulbifer sp. OS29]|uniref:FMN dependent NADH:quinone oxidoreductase n=1 Tax=Microbulbifer okhotskensis TaxID=2926617 RepID=A0A9X2J626_9GAMM|nr:NAD(P)H-dependent oxidoreductase [Microbulbifer okhotskensis]MCO1336177.1 NAD(P)H-dependent oxidoreductase [Microbulbifer okhotskensis]
MKTLLHIDASAQQISDIAIPEDSENIPRHSSISKAIATSFIRCWRQQKPQDKVIHGDVGINPPGFINQAWIAAVFTPDDKRSEAQRTLVALSDTLIEEVDQADVIVMSSSMYNYGMPAALKSWFDQIIRINKTFTFDLTRGDYPLEPKMSGKTLVLITSAGEFGFAVGGIREKMNHLGPHIQTLSHYLGVEEFHEINVEFQEFGDQRHQNSIREALAQSTTLAVQLTSNL